MGWSGAPRTSNLTVNLTLTCRTRGRGGRRAGGGVSEDVPLVLRRTAHTHTHTHTHTHLPLALSPTLFCAIGSHGRALPVCDALGLIDYLLQGLSYLDSQAAVTVLLDLLCYRLCAHLCCSNHLLFRAMVGPKSPGASTCMCARAWDKKYSGL